MSDFTMNKGKRWYQCADCLTQMLFHSQELSRRCKPRCKGCGGTFFEPLTKGAKEMSENIGTARVAVENMPPVSGKEHHTMQ